MGEVGRTRLAGGLRWFTEASNLPFLESPGGLWETLAEATVEVGHMGIEAGMLQRRRPPTLNEEGGDWQFRIVDYSDVIPPNLKLVN